MNAKYKVYRYDVFEKSVKLLTPEPVPEESVLSALGAVPGDGEPFYFGAMTLNRSEAEFFITREAIVFSVPEDFEDKEAIRLIALMFSNIGVEFIA